MIEEEAQGPPPSTRRTYLYSLPLNDSCRVIAHRSWCVIDYNSQVPLLPTARWVSTFYKIPHEKPLALTVIALTLLSLHWIQDRKAVALPVVRKSSVSTHPVRGQRFNYKMSRYQHYQWNSRRAYLNSHSKAQARFEIVSSEM